jgi:hypothetical protein
VGFFFAATCFALFSVQGDQRKKYVVADFDQARVLTLTSCPPQ